ncbi:MAG TPA: chemotaxis protein CheX [Tepidisphaeraceae bacterium]|nr:chemotaxis protein CheX [Tepidisphaeraceae bacterium]
MMDVRFINPFLSAVGLVLRTMADMSVAVGKPHLKTMRANADRIYTVSALIELSGSVKGAVCMRFSPAVVSALVKSFSGAAPKQIDDDCLDAIGEIANMVVGNARKDFPIGNTTMSLPKVSIGDPLEDPPVLVLPFECACGRFLIEARIKTVGDDLERTE